MEEPKYNIGQTVKVNNWSSSIECDIIDVKRIFHRRLFENCWGYKMNKETGLTMDYVPEGYLRTIKLTQTNNE